MEEKKREEDGGGRRRGGKRKRKSGGGGGGRRRKAEVEEVERWRRRRSVQMSCRCHNNVAASDQCVSSHLLAFILLHVLFANDDAFGTDADKAFGECCQGSQGVAAIK